MLYLGCVDENITKHAVLMKHRFYFASNSKATVAAKSSQDNDGA